MFPTEAYLIAALVGIVLTTLAVGIWDTIDEVEKYIVAGLILACMVGVFLLTGEIWWLVRSYPMPGAGA